MTTPRWNDPKSVQAAIQRNREMRGTDPEWWQNGIEVPEQQVDHHDRIYPETSVWAEYDAALAKQKLVAKKANRVWKQYLLVGLILICAWVVASVAIRIFGILAFGLQNSEMSVGVVSVLAVVGVAVWIWWSKD